MTIDKDECETILRELTDKKYIFFTNRCNTAIKLVLKFIKQNLASNNISSPNLFIQDQGGWMTYSQFAKKLKFTKRNIITNDSNLTSESIIATDIKENDTVILNSMGGYLIKYNMQPITKEIKNKKAILVNDVCGTIGTNEAKYGDYIVGSFGRWKPVNNGYGGFIATNDKNFTDFFRDNPLEVKDMYTSLLKKLKSLNDRLKFLKTKKETIIIDLKDKFNKINPNLNIIHENKNGLNIGIIYRDELEKENLINYCNKNNLEYVQCPMYIRINKNAISIEIKRLNINN